MEIGVHAAKTNFSALLRRVSAGEEVVILRGSTPIAKVVPVRAPRVRRLGPDAGAVTVSADFDAPLPPEERADFER